MTRLLTILICTGILALAAWSDGLFVHNGKIVTVGGKAIAVVTTTTTTTIPPVTLSAKLTLGGGYGELQVNGVLLSQIAYSAIAQQAQSSTSTYAYVSIGGPGAEEIKADAMSELVNCTIPSYTEGKTGTITVVTTTNLTASFVVTLGGGLE